MSDTSVLLFINGLSGKVPALDEFFKGISNDYFPIISACLALTWLWFATRDDLRREVNQRAVMTAIISIAVVSGLVALSTAFYSRVRPFDALPDGSLNLLFYRPTDSSFPSNLAAVLFAIAVSVITRNRVYGSCLLALAVFSSFGRVYIGIHYPLDIIGGAAVGTVSAFIAVGIARLLKPGVDYFLKLLQNASLA
jgi:undecaprenyl-diphosphatase